MLHSTTGKTNWAVILIVVIAAAVLFGYIQIPGLNLGNFKLPFSTTTGGNGSGLGNVTRKIAFSVVDKYSGSALGSVSNGVNVYSAAGIKLETLNTGSDGIATTANTYSTGQVLDVNWIDGNSKIWYQVTVPGMSSNDAFSQTTNPVQLEAFSIGTYTGTLTSQGTTYATNYADGNGTTPTFNIEVVNTGADNTGMMNSAIPDPVYGQSWLAELVVKVTGSGYEGIVLNGFDQTFTLGTTLYGVKALDVNQLTKWKVGSSYQYGYQGDQIQSFGVDLTGLTTNTTALTYYARAYADPSYALGHGGNFGTNMRQLATGSCTFIHYS